VPLDVPPALMDRIVLVALNNNSSMQTVLVLAIVDFKIMEILVVKLVNLAILHVQHAQIQAQLVALPALLDFI